MKNIPKHPPYSSGKPNRKQGGKLHLNGVYKDSSFCSFLYLRLSLVTERV